MAQAEFAVRVAVGLQLAKLLGEHDARMMPRSWR